jgi:hypothetical protein
MKKYEWTILFTLALAVAVLASGCDNSCDKEGATQCSGVSLETCKDGEWDSEDCFTDFCEPKGYSSGSCEQAEYGSGYECTCE